MGRKPADYRMRGLLLALIVCTMSKPTDHKVIDDAFLTREELLVELNRIEQRHARENEGISAQLARLNARLRVKGGADVYGETPFEYESEELVEPTYDHVPGAHFSSHLIYYSGKNNGRGGFVMLCKNEQCYSEHPYVLSACFAIAAIWLVYGIVCLATHMISGGYKLYAWCTKVCNDGKQQVADGCPSHDQCQDASVNPVCNNDKDVILIIEPENETLSDFAPTDDVLDASLSVIDLPGRVDPTEEVGGLLLGTLPSIPEDEGKDETGDEHVWEVEEKRNEVPSVETDAHGIGSTRDESRRDEQPSAEAEESDIEVAAEVKPVCDEVTEVKVQWSSMDATESNKENDEWNGEWIGKSRLDTIDEGESEDEIIDVSEDVLEEDNFDLGAPVKCQFSNEWIDGTITNLFNGIYTVRIEPGEFADSMCLSGLESPISLSRLMPALKVDDVVKIINGFSKGRGIIESFDGDGDPRIRLENGALVTHSKKHVQRVYEASESVEVALEKETREQWHPLEVVA